MTEDSYVSSFRQTEFSQCAADFWQKTDEGMKNHISEITGHLRENLHELFGELGKIQKRKKTEIGKITMSLIRMSAWEDALRMKLEAYDRDEIVGHLVCEKDMDVSMVFPEWNGLQKQLESVAEKKQVRSHITDPVIRFLMESLLGDMALYLYAVYKYVLLDAEELEGFQDFEKGRDFSITIGEYQDWQKPVFVRREPAEIRLHGKEESNYIFCRFENKSFKVMDFKDINLEKAKFVRCSFFHCTFENANLNDVRFVECRMHDVQFLSGTMYGAMLVDCDLIDTDMGGMEQKWVPFQGGRKEYDVYQDCMIGMKDEGAG